MLLCPKYQPDDRIWASALAGPLPVPSGAAGRTSSPSVPDCPGLDGACLVEAARRLRKTDVVLGPVADGGYYLIGLRRPAPQLFDGIAWSSEHVLQQTVERIAASGLSHQLLSVKEDIDDLESLRRHLENEASSVLRESWPNLTHAV